MVAAIATPTLVVAGGPRSPVPQEQIADLVGRLPDGQLVTVDAGHLVHKSEPDAFIRHVLHFLGGWPIGTTETPSRRKPSTSTVDNGPDPRPLGAGQGDLGLA